MIAPSHISFSQTFYLASCIFWSSPATPVGAFTAALASFIPDFDTRLSLPGRILPWLSDWIHAQFGHRSATHAFIPQLILWIIAYFAVTSNGISKDIAIAFAAGWFSHSCADMLTKTGVVFWWPFSRVRCVSWKNPKYRVDVTSTGEWLWSMSMFIIGIPLFFAAQTEQGAAGIIRHALGDIQLAVQEYQKYKGENAWYIDLKGRSNETLAQVNGRYYVIDVANESAFYVEDKEGHTVTISENANTDWYVNRAVLEKDEAELTKTFIVQKESIQKESLIKALHLTAKAHKTYVSGKLATEDKAGNIQARTLEYVPLQDLPNALWYHAVDVRVQVKHPPGVEIVELAIENDVPTVQRDEVVEKWFREMGVE